MLNKLKKINHKQKLELVASFTQKIMDSHLERCVVARNMKKRRTDENLQKGQANSWLYNNNILENMPLMSLQRE